MIEKMKTRKLIYVLLMGVMMTGFYSCAMIPNGAVAVKPFDKERYLGKWYEIARIDFKYERDLNNTTAVYTLNDNGTIKVDNQGYNTTDLIWVKHNRQK